MARMPAAQWVGEQSPRNPMSRYDVVCVHTIVGYAPAHAAHFSVKANGTILQSRDTRYQSAANLHGNPRVIAIENEDHGGAFGTWGGGNVPRLTDEQVEANGKILAWANAEHGIPLQLCPDSRPGSRGLAYHRQGIDGNFGGMRFPGRVSGGEVWTEHFGKVCPGDNRIAQLPDILAAARGGDSSEENDMQLTDDIYAKKGKSLTVRELFHQLDRFMANSAKRDQQLFRVVTQQTDEIDRAIDAGATQAELRRMLANLRRAVLAAQATEE